MTADYFWGLFFYAFAFVVILTILFLGITSVFRYSKDMRHALKVDFKNNQ